MVTSSAKIQEWSKRLDRFSRSGVSVSKFCRDEKITLQSFYYWRRRISIPLSVPPLPTIQEAKPSDPLFLSQVRFLIQAGPLKIECHVSSLQALEAFLSWASRQQNASQFQQLMVQG